jgi:hypothetical protein
MHRPAHQLTMTVPLTPDTANFVGHVHCGTILERPDPVACASRDRYRGRAAEARVVPGAATQR